MIWYDCFKGRFDGHCADSRYTRPAENAQGTTIQASVQLVHTWRSVNMPTWLKNDDDDDLSIWLPYDTPYELAIHVGYGLASENNSWIIQCHNDGDQYAIINVKTEFIYKCYRLTHRKQQKLELWIQLQSTSSQRRRAPQLNCRWCRLNAKLTYWSSYQNAVSTIPELMNSSI